MRTAADPAQLFLSAYCGIVAIQMLMHFRDQLAFFRTEPMKIHGGQPRLLGVVPLPPVNERVFVSAGILFIVALAAAAADVARELALVVALICFLIYFPPVLHLAYIRRKANLIPLVLTVALVAQNHLLIAVKILVALVYLSAGLEKLRTSGLRWMDGETLRASLIEHYLYSGREQALVLARRPALCQVLSTTVLTWELTFWLAIFLPALTWLYVAVGLLFHFGTSVTMRIHYWIYFCPVYVVFFVPLLSRLLARSALLSPK